MHYKGMNFTIFLLHCKGAILKAYFFAAHTVSRQTQCPPGETLIIFLMTHSACHSFPKMSMEGVSSKSNFANVKSMKYKPEGLEVNVLCRI